MNISSLKHWIAGAASAVVGIVVVSSIAINLATGQIGVDGADGSSSGLDNFYLIAYHAVDVPAKDAGVLVGVPVEEGDAIAIDQQLAQIDDREILMAVDIAEAKYKSARKQATNDVNIRAAEKQRDVYKAEFDVAMETNAKVSKTVSKTEIRRLKYQEVRSVLGIEQAKFEREIAYYDAAAAHKELARAEAMVDKMRIVSPVNGSVAKIYRREGNWVSPGDPVMRVVKMEQLRVAGALSSVDYAPANVKGQDVRITIELPGGQGTETLAGKIGFASPEIKDDLTFEIWVEIQNQKDGNEWRFIPGLSASLTFN